MRIIDPQNVTILEYISKSEHTEEELDDFFGTGVDVTGLEGILLRGFGTGACVKDTFVEEGGGCTASSSELDDAE